MNRLNGETTRFFRRKSQMGEHKHGEMDISVQEKTFDGFMKYVTRSVVVILVFLVLLAMING